MDQQRIIAVLKKAREFITDPKRWTQGVAFRDEAGHATEYRESACSACSLGAIWLSLNDFNHHDDVHIVTKALVATMGMRCIPRHEQYIAHFNDNHPEVLALFDETIARLEAN